METIGKHDRGTPINESLERHYQDEKKRLEAKVSEREQTINELMAEIERLKCALEMKSAQIEVLLEKLVER